MMISLLQVQFWTVWDTDSPTFHLGTCEALSISVYVEKMKIYSDALCTE